MSMKVVVEVVAQPVVGVVHFSRVVEEGSDSMPAVLIATVAAVRRQFGVAASLAYSWCSTGSCAWLIAFVGTVASGRRPTSRAMAALMGPVASARAFGVVLHCCRPYSLLVVEVSVVVWVRERADEERSRGCEWSRGQAQAQAQPSSCCNEPCCFAAAASAQTLQIPSRRRQQRYQMQMQSCRRDSGRLGREEVCGIAVLLRAVSSVTLTRPLRFVAV
jgi:hypothetical protein